jgi:2-dehydropantoate 2-reductase
VACSIEEVLDTAFDYVVVTTKAIPEVETTPHLLGPLVSGQYRYPQPTYVLLQNGLNVEKDLHAALKLHYDRPLIISCALYIMTNITADGEVTHGKFVCSLSLSVNATYDIFSRTKYKWGFTRPKGSRTPRILLLSKRL